MWGSSPTFLFRFAMSEDSLLGLIRSRVAELGFELVNLRRTGTAERPILQVRVDRPESRPGHGVTAEDCVLVSRSLERTLEATAMVGPRYVLEVSSPGLERPLREPEHWRRFVGRRAKVRAEGFPGRTEVEIVGVPDDEHVVVRVPGGGESSLPFATVQEATLVPDWASLGLGRGTPPSGARRPGRGRARRRRRGRA